MTSSRTYETSMMLDKDDNDCWGVLIGEFKTEKEAKEHIKKLNSVGKP